jgi:hypothetical protein
MKCLIINFNRVTLPKNLADWCFSHGLEPIFIDNNSDYPPLLEYYKECPYTVIYMDKNYSYLVVWTQRLLDKLGITGHYIVTDPDMDLSGIPDDFLSVMEEGLSRYPQYDKCGLSLEVNDIPSQGTRDWEMQFWQTPLDPQYFKAAVDTTFALYKVRHASWSGIRTNRPYTARHIPWYYDLLPELPEDEMYYYRTQLQEIRAHSDMLEWRKGLTW